MEERYFSRIQKKKRPFYVYGYIDNGKYFGSGWDGEMLYTKILVNRLCDSEKLYDVSQRLEKGCFEKTARIIADKMAKLIYDCVPDYLLSEWKFANRLASLPVIDSVVEALIENGMLVPPEDGVGAEGCWMGVEK